MQYHAFALAVALATLSPCARADEAALKAQIDALRAEIAELHAEMQQLRGEQRAASTQPANPPPAIASATSTPAAPAPAASATSLWGYGEMNYNHPTAHAADAQADLRRA